jgi:hypothetical protein
LRSEIIVFGNFIVKKFTKKFQHFQKFKKLYAEKFKFFPPQGSS